MIYMVTSCSVDREIGVSLLRNSLYPTNVPYAEVQRSLNFQRQNLKR